MRQNAAAATCATPLPSCERLGEVWETWDDGVRRLAPSRPANVTLTQPKNEGLCGEVGTGLGQMDPPELPEPPAQIDKDFTQIIITLPNTQRDIIYQPYLILRPAGRRFAVHLVDVVSFIPSFVKSNMAGATRGSDLHRVGRKHAEERRVSGMCDMQTAKDQGESDFPSLSRES
jgi:hypothetical protein